MKLKVTEINTQKEVMKNEINLETLNDNFEVQMLLASYRFLRVAAS